MKRREITILLLLLLAAGVRLARFDLMEFKYDEVTVIVEAGRWLGRGIPQDGMMSGVGVRNPPGFMFLLTPLTALTSSPLVICLGMVCFNVAAVWLIIRLGIELGSPGAGLWAGAFMAVHPWLVLYSRKIWAQSLLPFFVCLFLLVILRCLNRPRSRAIFWLGPIVCVTWQIHYSAYALLGFALLWLVHEGLRRRLNAFMLVLGALIGAFTLLPYAVYLAGEGAAAQANPLRVALAEGKLDNAWEIFRAWARTGFAGGFGYPFAFGFESLANGWEGGKGRLLEGGAVTATVLTFALALRALVAGRPNRDTRNAPSTSLWLGLFAVLPPLLYAVRGIPSPPHYFIVGLPALLMLAGEGMERVLGGRFEIEAGPLCGGKWRLAPGVIMIVCGLVVWTTMLLEIDRGGGTAGDYGVGYRAQRAAARILVEEGVATRGIDARLTRDHSIGIYYLMSTVLPRPERRAGRTAKLIDTLRYSEHPCGLEATERRKAGPLRICLYGP